MSSGNAGVRITSANSPSTSSVFSVRARKLASARSAPTEVSIEAPIAASRSSSQSPGCAALPPLRMVSPVMDPRPTRSSAIQVGVVRT